MSEPITDIEQLYHAALVAGGVEGYSWEDCWRDYRITVIRELFVPVWQWSSGMQAGVWWLKLKKSGSPSKTCVAPNF